MYRPLPECGSHCRLTTHSDSRLQPQSSPTPSIFCRGSCLPTTKNRCGCRYKDCRSPFHYGNKLFILAASTLYPDTAPSSRCRARLHIGMSSNLRLLFRTVDAGLLHSFLHFARTPYTSRGPPTHRGCSRLHSKPPALTPTPRPDERSAILAYTSAGVRPLHLLRAACGSRHGGVGS